MVLFKKTIPAVSIPVLCRFYTAFISGVEGLIIGQV
jgi:hypothetical protein